MIKSNRWMAWVIEESAKMPVLLPKKQRAEAAQREEVEGAEAA